MWAQLVWITFIAAIGHGRAVTIESTTSSTATSTANKGGKYPCAFANTVNITDGVRLRDGSYSYADLVIPADLIAEYNFKVIDGVEYHAPRHLRGCVCLLKPCITFCCHPDEIFDAQNWNCTRAKEPRLITHIDVTRGNNGSVDQVKIADKFIVRTELGCRNKFIDKKHDSFWQWDLYENGSLWRDNRLWSTDEYCFTLLEHNQAVQLTPLNCERFQRGYRVWIYAICKGGILVLGFSNPGLFLRRQHHCHPDQHLCTLPTELHQRCTQESLWSVAHLLPDLPDHWLLLVGLPHAQESHEPIARSMSERR